MQQLPSGVTSIRNPETGLYHCHQWLPGAPHRHGLWCGCDASWQCDDCQAIIAKESDATSQLPEHLAELRQVRLPTVSQGLRAQERLTDHTCVHCAIIQRLGLCADRLFHIITLSVASRADILPDRMLSRLHEPLLLRLRYATSKGDVDSVLGLITIICTPTLEPHLVGKHWINALFSVVLASSARSRLLATKLLARILQSGSEAIFPEAARKAIVESFFAATSQVRSRPSAQNTS